MINKISKILKDELNLDESMKITEDTVLREDLDADSLNMVEIIMALEEEFEIEMPEDELDSLDNLQTVGDLEKYILTKVGE